MHEVVVTGYSLITSLGIRNEEFSKRMFEGQSGVVSILDLIGDQKFPILCAALLPKGIYPPLELDDIQLEIETVLTHLINGVIEQTGGWNPVDAIIYGTNFGIAKVPDILSFHGSQVQNKNAHLSSDYGLEFVLKSLSRFDQSDLSKKNKLVCSNGCVTGLSAISYAMQRIQVGLNERILVVTDEERVRSEDLLKYHSIGALSRESYKNASCPFSKGRSGFVRGEGAGIIILESRESANIRKAKIYGSMLGYGQSSDAWRLTEGRIDLKGAVTAMNRALKNAELSPGQIDYVNAHGSSTAKNDQIETAAIKQVFGDDAYRVPISALKSQVGHLNYACSVVEVIASLMMIEQSKIAPTINYTERDPSCDLNYVPNVSIDAEINYVMKNSFGLGGSNACLIIGKH